MFCSEVDQFFNIHEVIIKSFANQIKPFWCFKWATTFWIQLLASFVHLGYCSKLNMDELGFGEPEFGRCYLIDSRIYTKWRSWGNRCYSCIFSIRRIFQFLNELRQLRMCSRSVINFFNKLLFNFIVGTFGIIIFEEKFSIFLREVFKLALDLCR